MLRDVGVEVARATRCIDGGAGGNRGGCPGNTDGVVDLRWSKACAYVGGGGLGVSMRTGMTKVGDDGNTFGENGATSGLSTEHGRGELAKQ